MPKVCGMGNQKIARICTAKPKYEGLFEKEKTKLRLRSCLQINSHPEEKLGKIKRKHTFTVFISPGIRCCMYYRFSETY